NLQNEVSMALGQRLKEVRVQRGMSQAKLGALADLTQAAIGALESRDSKHSSMALQLARALHVSVDWLVTGEGPKSVPDADGECGDTDLYAGAPLNERDVMLHLLLELPRDLETERTKIVQSGRAVFRFAKTILTKADVIPESAVCTSVWGNSMAPVLPDGARVVVDTDDVSVKDGEIYAVNHDGMLRVKYLRRKPGGGLEIISQNSAEYAAETYSAEQVASGNIEVIGRVFWWSVLR
ncbi:XRE family transcriptional regulator, partial [Marinobacter sp. ELB17]|uniref:XRE family transcriptional regulator n=1 Tax=Marinobacter sp. ELB17 TaxID=270374 RepID=UPI0000F380DF